MLVCPKCGSTYTRSLEFCGLDGERLIESASDPLIGRTIDRYRVVETIGSGGMAKVYRATHIFLEQDFAIKVLHGQIAADKSFAIRFHREATTLGKIKHRNVVQVSDFGATKEGLLFLVMEHLDGPSLTHAIKSSAPFTPVRAAGIARQLALGLGAAHSRGFVHRDLKPGNVILMEEDGIEVPKILDFGLVRLLEPDDGPIPTQLTQHGMMFGTPAYMSPEQISGEDIDSRADLYSLGVLLYQMIVGHTPFVGEVGELVKQHVTVKPPHPAQDYAGLTPLAMKLLEKQPKDRPQSATEVVDTIDRLGLIPSSSGISSSPGSQKPERPKRRSESTRPFTALDVELDTRAERAERYGTDESMEIERSARAALGFRAHWRWVLALGLLAVIAFTVWVAKQNGLLVRYWPAASGAVEAPPPPETAQAPPPAPDPTPPPVKPRSKKPVVEAPPPPPAQPPPPPRSAPPPRAEEEEEERRVSLEELDSSIGWTLSSRGLSWEDLDEVETQAVWNWRKWVRMKAVPTQAELRNTHDKLMETAQGLVIDRDLLASKLARARITLSRVPDSARDDRYRVLQSRADELDASVRSQTLSDPAERISAQITLLESDAENALAASTSTSH